MNSAALQSGAGAPGPAAPEAKAKAKAKAKASGARQRVHLDLDDVVTAARKRAKEAKTVLKYKQHEARLAERKKMRLVAKASKLPSDDLLRIGLYKRVSLVNTALRSDLSAREAPQPFSPHASRSRGRLAVVRCELDPLLTACRHRWLLEADWLEAQRSPGCHRHLLYLRGSR